MAYERQPVEDNDLGSTIRNVIRQYGPMAAVAAAAIPAVVLARGRGGEEMLNVIRRFAPKHLKVAEESPVTYIFKMAEDALERAEGPAFHHPRPVAGGLTWPGMPHPQWPGTLGHLVTTPQELLGGTMHEFGHLTGFERVRGQYPQAAPKAVLGMGTTHQDLLEDPAMKRMISGELQKTPELGGYYLDYLQSTRLGSNPEAGALGELANEIWAQRMLRRGGARGELPGSARRVLGDDPYLSAARTHGTLPPNARARARQVYDRLLDMLRHNREWTPPY